MNRKKLLIAIIAIVLVLAVLLVIYFDYRSKHSLSRMSDEELQEYLEEAGAEQTLTILDISSIREIIKKLEKDPAYFPTGFDSEVRQAFTGELRPAFRDYYGIDPRVVPRHLMGCEKLMILLAAVFALAVLLLLYLLLFKRSSINRKKLFIMIIAIVLVAAVLLVTYFGYRSRHSLSLMSDEELLQYFENDIRLGWKLYPSQLRAIIQGFEHDPERPNDDDATNFYFVLEQIRAVVKEYYGISP